MALTVATVSDSRKKFKTS